MSRKALDIANKQCPLLRRASSAYTPPEGNALTRDLAVEGTKDEGVSLRMIEGVEASPVSARSWRGDGKRAQAVVEERGGVGGVA